MLYQYSLNRSDGGFVRKKYCGENKNMELPEFLLSPQYKVKLLKDTFKSDDVFHGADPGDAVNDEGKGKPCLLRAIQ